jgi:hypothetical protein
MCAVTSAVKGMCKSSVYKIIYLTTASGSRVYSDDEWVISDYEMTKTCTLMVKKTIFVSGRGCS